MNLKSSETADLLRCVLDLPDKRNSRERINVLYYKSLVSPIYGKILKSRGETITLRYQLQHEIMDSNYLMNPEFSYIEVYFTEQNSRARQELLDHTKQSPVDPFTNYFKNRSSDNRRSN